MPQKNNLNSSSATKELISTGPRHVFKNSDQSKEKLKKPLKETTTRALVLRNGKYGTRGTGEIMLASRMTGREKLDLLAGKGIAVINNYRLMRFNKRISSRNQKRQYCVPSGSRNV